MNNNSTHIKPDNQENASSDDRGADRCLKRYFADLRRLPLITVDEEIRLAKRIRRGDHAALKRLVEANLRFVVSYVKRYQGLGVSFFDLINEGNVGLIEAAKRFDPTKRVKFITYASFWIRQSVITSLEGQAGFFRLPGRLNTLRARLSEARGQLTNKLQRKPTPEEVADFMGVTVSEFKHLLRMIGEVLSLDMVTDEQSGLLLSDRLEQTGFSSPEEAYLSAERNETIRGSLAVLPPMHQKILEMRFGIGCDELTLQQVGDYFHLSRERIRQIQSEALRELRRKKTARLYTFIRMG